MSEVAAVPAAAPETIAEAAQPANDNATPSAPAAASEGAQPSAETASDLKDAKAAGELTAAQFKILADGGKIPLKVYGKERMVGAEEALRLLSVNAGGDDAMRTAAEERKRAKAELEKAQALPKKLQEALSKDFMGTVRKLGLEDFMWSALEQEAAYLQLPEDQRAQRDLEAQRAQLEREKAAWKAEQERAQQTAQERRAQERAMQDAKALNQEWAQGLDAAGFGKSELQRKRAMRWMAERAQTYLDNDLPMPSGTELAKEAREFFAEEVREYARSIDPAAAEQELGPELLRQLRQAEVAKLKTTQARADGGQFATGNVAKPAPTQPEARKRFSGSYADWEAARLAALKGR